MLEAGELAKLAYFNDIVVGAVCCRVDTASTGRKVGQVTENVFFYLEFKISVVHNDSWLFGSLSTTWYRYEDAGTCFEHREGGRELHLHLPTRAGQ